MIRVIPAIDLKDGKCVRLQQGLKEKQTVYCDDPVKMARHWMEEGGQFLHVVDLDGAFDGRPRHQKTVREISKSLDIPFEIGGGLRTDEQIQEMLDAGASRVVLGTRACEHPEELARLEEKFGGDQIAVGIDARNGKVQTKGWVETSTRNAADLARDVSAAGIKTIIYTDTSRDGMLKGVNARAVGEICGAVSCEVVASGGISSLADMTKLRELGFSNLVGAIVGKALYDKKITIAELEASQG